MRRTVLVTGASGFMGRHLVRRLAECGWQVRATVRQPATVACTVGVEAVPLGDLRGPVAWEPLVDGATHVLHLAGLAHASAAIPAAVYDAVNGTAAGDLARAAGRAGVQRLLVMSSVRAQSGPQAGDVLDESATPTPTDAYGRSKLAGERLTMAAVAGCKTEVVILRPVVVYGPGVKANMAVLARLAWQPLPLPLGTANGRRSILGLDNLASAVVHVLESPSAAGRTFLVADPDPLSIGEMVTALRSGLGRRPGLLPVPARLVAAVAAAAGKSEAWARLSGDLVVSTARLEATGWQPSVRSRNGLAAWMREEAAGSAAGL